MVRRGCGSAALILALNLVATAALAAQRPQQDPGWEAFDFLAGEWVAEGSGTPGEATGSFSFSRDLDGKILVRRNRADYPPAKDRPAHVHADLMVVYHERDGTTRANYFDNEGHVINYTVSVARDLTSITFLSEALPSAPRFRFIYSKEGKDRLRLQFDIAPPGKPEVFSKYVEGVAHRKAAAN
jgi:hypothetical protein